MCGLGVKSHQLCKGQTLEARRQGKRIRRKQGTRRTWDTYIWVHLQIWLRPFQINENENGCHAVVSKFP